MRSVSPKYEHFTTCNELTEGRGGPATIRRAFFVLALTIINRSTIPYLFNISEGDIVPYKVLVMFQHSSLRKKSEIKAT